MPQNDLIVEVSDGPFDASVALDNYATIAGRLDEKHVVGFLVKLDHHGCMVELRLSCEPGQSAAEMLALEEQYIKSVSGLQELLLRYLLLFPKARRQWRQGLLPIAL